MDKKPTTGKYSQKMYKCTKCGKKQVHGTNHWGFIYPRCSCGETLWECLEKVPDGYGIPEQWKKVRLGDIVEIVEIKNEK
jgi:hypothetical protein